MGDRLRPDLRILLVDVHSLEGCCRPLWVLRVLWVRNRYWWAPAGFLNAARAVQAARAPSRTRQHAAMAASAHGPAARSHTTTRQASQQPRRIEVARSGRTSRKRRRCAPRARHANGRTAGSPILASSGSSQKSRPLRRRRLCDSPASPASPGALLVTNQERQLQHFRRTWQAGVLVSACVALLNRSRQQTEFRLQGPHVGFDACDIGDGAG